MKQQLNADLRPHAEQLLKGDFLNAPVLHRVEFEKVVHFCIALLHEKNFENVSAIKNLENKIEELTKTVEALSVPHKKNKWKT